MGYEEYYGVKTSDIREIFSKKKSPIVVGGLPLTGPLRKAFPDSLSIFLVSDLTKQRQIMQIQGRTEMEINKRLEKQRQVTFDAYDKNLYDYIVTNNYDTVAEVILAEIISKARNCTQTDLSTGRPIYSSINGAVNLNDMVR